MCIRSVLKLCAAGLAALSVSAATTWTETAKLTASDGTAEELLGWSTAIDGPTLVAGAPQEATIAKSGEAYVFVRGANGWTTGQQTAVLKASDGIAYDQFGWSVAVSGDVVVVGAFNNPAAEVYVFVKPENGWRDMTETAKLTLSGPVAAEFGYSVSISGDTIVATGFLNNYTRGVAYVFIKPASGWIDATQTAVLTDGQMQDSFGYVAAVSGNSVLVSAPEADGGAGAAYIYQKPASGWVTTAQPEAKLVRSSATSSDIIGYSAALFGHTAVLGSPNANLSQGAADLYVEPESGWSGTLLQTAELTDPALSGIINFGGSVAVHGLNVVTGASAILNFEGAAFVYQRPSTGWVSSTTPSSELLSSPRIPDEQNGWSVASATGVIATGAPMSTVNAKHGQGAVYVFEAK